MTSDSEMYKDFFLVDISDSESVIRRPYRSNMVRGMSRIGMTFAAYDKAIGSLKREGLIRETGRSLIVTAKGQKSARRAKQRVPTTVLKHFGSI